MTTYNTMNPVPSADARDRYDNSQVFDDAVNGDASQFTDRLGRPRKSLSGMEADFSSAQDQRKSDFDNFLLSSGYQDIGEYAAGLNITTRNQIFIRDGEYYRPSAGLALPYLTTGDWTAESPKFVSVGDAALRQELGSPSGSSLVRFSQEANGFSPRSVESKLRDTVSILDFGAVEGGDVDCSPAFRSALATGKAVFIPRGTWLITEPVSIFTTGQEVFGEGMGYGYGSPSSALRDFVPVTRLIIKQSFTKRLMTRRKWRGSAADPTDDFMSSGVEIHADGAKLSNFAVWLDCDYSNTSPTNFGPDVDNGVFVGCRPGVSLERIGVFGYFRKAGYYWDVTRDTQNLSELKDYWGNTLPSGASGLSFSGGDGVDIRNPYVRGAKVAVAVLGAIHPGGNYYNEVSGLTVLDRRGASGCSDFNVWGGRLYPGGHHSGRRLADPIISPLTQAGLESEPDFAPAALYIDGWSANSGSTTHSIGAVRGFCFFGTRFASPEKFRVRLGTCDEVYFIGRGWSENGTNGGTFSNTAGVPIETNDYTNYTYGHYAAHSVNTGSVHIEGAGGGVNQRWLESGKWSGSDAAGTSRNLAAIINGDSSLLPGNRRAMLEIADTAPTANEKTGISIRGFRPQINFSDRSPGDADFTLRAEAGLFQLRYGDDAVPLPLATTAFEASANIGKFTSKLPFGLAVYTVATLPSAATMGQGTIVACSNGDSGKACLAAAQSGGWRRISYGSTVSET